MTTGRIPHLARATIAAFALIAIEATEADAADTLKKIRDSGTVTLGYRESSMPFSYLNRSKQPVGYSIDLCNKVVGAVKRELKMSSLAVKMVAVTPATRIPDLTAGKIDLECGSTTNTAERRKQVAFTISTYIAGAKFVSKTSSKIKSLDDLAKKTVVTTQGTTTEKILRGLDAQSSMKMEILLGKDHAESFSMVASGKAEAFFMDDILLYSLRAESGAPQDYEVSGKLLSIEPLSLMLRNDDAAFKRIVDLEITRVIMDGEIYALYKKWFQSPIPPKGTNLKVPMNFLLRDSFKAPSDQLFN
jgi:glutamate/aspartate transport system substrate-binding protein